MPKIGTRILENPTRTNRHMTYCDHPAPTTQQTQYNPPKKASFPSSENKCYLSLTALWAIVIQELVHTNAMEIQKICLPAPQMSATTCLMHENCGSKSCRLRAAQPTRLYSIMLVIFVVVFFRYAMVVGHSCDACVPFRLCHRLSPRQEILCQILRGIGLFYYLCI